MFAGGIEVYRNIIYQKHSRNNRNGIIEIKSECERVSKDEPIFRYYNANEEELVNKINDI